MISGDSGEYEFLTEGIQLSANVDGMAIEIGLRRGMGTKTILDAVRRFCPSKRVLSIDPYGSIPYVGREHIGEIRLDYDNPMKYDCMVDIWTDVRDNPVNYDFMPFTDDFFFEIMANGVPRYEEIISIDKWYSFAHLDGPHNYEHVSKESIWLDQRMKTGSTIVIDDCTPDFIDIVPVNKLFDNMGWILYKEGQKKNIYVKR